MNGTPGGSAGSANDAPGRRLGLGWGVGDGEGDGAAVAGSCAAGVALVVATGAAAGEHPTIVKSSAVRSQRPLGMIMRRTFLTIGT